MDDDGEESVVYTTEEEDDDDESSSDADLEWQESIDQLLLLLNLVLLPFAGKYFGRKLAYLGEGLRWISRQMLIGRSLGTLCGMEVSSGSRV